MVENDQRALPCQQKKDSPQYNTIIPAFAGTGLFFGSLRMQLIDKLVFECPKTGYKADIEFHGKVCLAETCEVVDVRRRVQPRDGDDLAQRRGDSPSARPLGLRVLPLRREEAECGERGIMTRRKRSSWT